MNIHCCDPNFPAYLERLTEQDEIIERDPALFEGFAR
jgi:hypothetical protein